MKNPSEKSAETARQSDPFEGFGRSDVPPPQPHAPKDETSLKDSDLPADFHKLVGEKRRAGLTREQAEQTVRAQILRDRQAAGESKGKQNQAAKA